MTLNRYAAHRKLLKVSHNVGFRQELPADNSLEMSLAPKPRREIHLKISDPRLRFAKRGGVTKLLFHPREPNRTTVDRLRDLSAAGRLRQKGRGSATRGGLLNSAG